MPVVTPVDPGSQIITWPQTTGSMNTAGMCAGKPSYGQTMKLFGIEDFWGNVSEWVEGIYTDSSCNYITFWTPGATSNTPITGNNLSTFTLINKNNSGFIADFAGDNATGFAPIKYDGSSSTFGADYASVHSDKVAEFGGYGGAGDSAGPFCLMF